MTTIYIHVRTFLLFPYVRTDQLHRRWICPKNAHITQNTFERERERKKRENVGERGREQELQNANIKQIVSGKDIINISMISRKLALITETIFGKNEKNWPHIESRKEEANCRRRRSVPTHVYGLIALLTETKKCTHFNKCAWAGSVFKPTHFTCDFYQFCFWHKVFWCKATVQCCRQWSLYHTA